MDKRTLVFGSACAVLCEVLFGLGYMLTKVVTNEVDALELLGWRFGIALACMGVLVALGIIRVDLSGKSLKPLIPVALCQPVVYYMGETLGIQLTTASESGSLLACIPVVALVFSSVILHRRPTRCQVSGILLTLAGVVVCVCAKGVEMSLNVLGYLVLLAGIIAYSLYVVLVERTPQYSIFEKAFVMIAFGACVYVPAALVRGAASGSVLFSFVSVVSNPTVLFVSLYLGIACSVGGFLLMNKSIALVGTNRNVSFVGVSTVVSIVASVGILGESFSALQAVGVAAVISGVALANWPTGSSDSQGASAPSGAS